MGAIILFHDFAEKSKDPLQLSFSQLEGIIDGLIREGYKFGTPLQVAQVEEGHLIAMTIDDGFVSSLKAVNILHKYGIRPTVFVNPGEVGRKNSWRRNCTFNTRVLTLAELQELASNADIEYHGWKHQSVLSLSKTKFIAECFLSIVWFYFHLQRRPQLFAYPFGEVNQKIADLASMFFKATFLVSPQEDDYNLGISRYEVFAGKKTSIIIDEIAAFCCLA